MIDDFLIVGAGIFGVSTAIELRKRGHRVRLLNPAPIPHPLASSTDISKVVRMEYGTDREYFDMAEQSIQGWLEWNELFGETLYHEVGFLLLCQQAMDSNQQSFERASYDNLLRKGYAPERLNAEQLIGRFPAFRQGAYQDGFYNPKAGFVESGRAIGRLAEYAAQLGVEVHEGQTVAAFQVEKEQVNGVQTQSGEEFKAGQVIVCAGAHTPLLLPELQDLLEITGHPVFHLRPKDPELFRFPQLAVFAADISNTGWYGFPLHPREGVVKVAQHCSGLVLDPEKEERKLYAEDYENLRAFLAHSFPALVDAEVVYTRRCLYTDTRDGHFWIDRHPGIKGLSVATGGSGHGMKMGPVIGKLIADVAETGKHQWADRYGWRDYKDGGEHGEEARNKD